ncbi:MAG TPA: DUF4384 domain-containing protein [Blastocatellia bacterium]|nr:DUF4384 domain-containing protein [Blastocatellia bacterium]
MKTLIRSLLIIGMIVSASAVPAIAQRKTSHIKTDQSNAELARGLFLNKRADAMSILILKLESGSLVPVDPGHEFKAGDQIKVEFQSNFNGIIYVINISPSGKRRILFPSNNPMDNTVQADRRYTLPPGGDTIEFDNEVGTEVLQVIMVKQRIPAFDTAIKDSGGWLAETAASAAAELQGGITNKDVTPALPDEDRGKMQSRDIILAPGKDKEKEGSVVAIPDKAGSGGRLKPGEMAPFEIRLKHT